MSRELAHAVEEGCSDAVASVFEPDFLLPSQFLVPDEEGLGGGERRLMAALLSDGVEAYISHCVGAVADTPSDGKTFSGIVARHSKRSDAQDWVETVDESYVFSFDNVCISLGINPAYLRMGLMRYVEAIIARRRESNGQTRVWKKIRRPRKH